MNDFHSKKKLIIDVLNGNISDIKESMIRFLNSNKYSKKEKISSIINLINHIDNYKIINLLSKLALKKFEDTFFINKYTYTNFNLNLHEKNEIFFKTYKTKITKINNRDTLIAKYNIAISCRELGKFDKAIKILELNKTNIRSKLEIANLLHLKKDYSKRSELFKQLYRRKNLTNEERIYAILGHAESFKNIKNEMFYDLTLAAEKLLIKTIVNDKIEMLFEIYNNNKFLNNNEKCEEILYFITSLKPKSLKEKQRVKQAINILINEYKFRIEDFKKSTMGGKNEKKIGYT